MMYEIFVLFFLSVSICSCNTIVSTKNHIKILSQNVGGAEFTLSSFIKISPVCPAYKLCRESILIKIRDDLQLYKPDIIHFQEILNSSQLKNKINESLSILSKHYDFFCAKGGGGLYEICTAWNTKRVSLINNNCESYSTQDSGVLKCVFNIEGEKVSTLNVHPSAWDTNDRNKLLQHMWSKMILTAEKSIIAGDLNTHEQTFEVSGKLPYPEDFGTVFGIFKKNFGRWKVSADFFGYQKFDKKTNSWTIRKTTSTVFREKIDHIFSNFGDLLPANNEDSMPCGNFVCVGGIDGYQWIETFENWSFFTGWGPKIDHTPILAILKW